jgi:hypothetical protein
MFVLDDRSVFEYLVDQKILRKEECAQYQALPLDGKNFSLAIEAKVDGVGQRSLIVKQTPIADQDESPFLGERLLTELLTKFKHLQHLQDYGVMMQDYDAENRVVIAEFLPEYQDLDGYYDEQQQFLPAIAQQAGQILAEFHRSTYQQNQYRDFLANYDQDLIDPSPPEHWAEIPLLVPEDFGQRRQDAWEFFRLYQNDAGLQQAIAQLQEHWQSCCLTHQDLRLNNWLVHRSDITKPLRLIDWEALQWGDPLADLGNLLAEYLLCWLESLDPAPGLPIGMVLQRAAVPLEQLQPSLQAIVVSYVQVFPQVMSIYPNWSQMLMGWTGRALLNNVQVHLDYYLPFDRQQRIIYQVAKQLICQPQAALAEIFGQHRFDQSPI